MRYLLINSELGKIVFESEDKDLVLKEWDRLDEEESEGDLPFSFHMEETDLP